MSTSEIKGLFFLPSGDTDREADRIACIRTVIVLTYVVTNCFIIAGVIRHWN